MYHIANGQFMMIQLILVLEILITVCIYYLNLIINFYTSNFYNIYYNNLH